MTDRQLAKQLQPVAARIRQARLWTGLGIVWFSAAAAGLAILLMNRLAGWEIGLALTALLMGALLAALSCVWFALQSARDYRWLAQRIEAKFPDLDSSLLTAIEQVPQLPGGRYGFLQENVIRRAFYHGYRHPWYRLVPTWRLAVAHLANVTGGILLVVALMSLVLFSKSPTTEPGIYTFDEVAIVSAEYRATIEPGDAEVEKGTSLLVLARFQSQIPPGATLVYDSETGDQRRVKMSKSLDDPVFGGRIASVQQPLTYRVEFGDQVSDSYQVTVYEHPELTRADAKLAFPSYTSMEEKLVQDVRRVSAVEGTEMTLICQVNKPLKEALLVEQNAEPIKLVADAANPTVYTAQFKLDRSRRVQLQLIDNEGRQNKVPPEFVINVLPNRPADLKLVLPTRDVQVSPIEELDVQASAWDDFGLKRVGLSYAMAGTSAKDVILGQLLAAKEHAPLEHVLAFESLEAEPDQLLSYYFWAEDVGPDGNVRRTSSDMYFAEVRHFEEIFRQGQQPPGGASQQQQQQQQGEGANAQEAEQLAELQKEIINGTWKVIRRETRDQPTAQFGEDATLLRESQSSALEQVDALAEKLEDPQSLAHVDAVKQHMQQAITQLKAAGDGPSIESLQPALSAEQAAYQALLRLRAREHEVIQTDRQQQQQGQSQSARNSSSRAQQQLQQLQLRDDENRYETQQTASPQETQEQREDRQVLNRLRELAQRQNDLNKRIKELQSALEAARTPEEKEEVERQLKRLRDEQQQILRDTEELQERTQRPENQQRMADQQQQLDRARENVRQSSEALREGMVSRAAAEGTRAERELENLREEFQQRTSGQFTEQMRQMRQQARELEEKQQEVSERLDELSQSQQQRSNSLRSSGDREQVSSDLEQQRQGVQDLLEQMRQTIEEAEASEPLLAEQLYDTIRDTRRQNPEQSLESAARSLNSGLVEDARSEERQARAGIGQLRQGIDRAAESVLGDETEALRRAQEELQRLTDQLNDEIARANPRSPDGGQNDGERQNEEGRQGQQGQQGQETVRPDGQENSQSSGGRDQAANDSAESPNGGGRQPNESPSETSPQASGQNADGQPQRSDNESSGSPQQGGGESPQSPQQGGQRPNGSQQPGLGGAANRDQPNRDQANGGGGGLRRFLDNGDDRRLAPIAGEDFLDWSDRLRDVEEMIADPELRAEAARVRDRAKAIRKDVKRLSQPPNWDIVREMVSQPLVELQNRVAEELLRRSSKDALVPIDRDPVPAQFEEQVRLYYERLGSGK